MVLGLLWVHGDSRVQLKTRERLFREGAGVGAQQHAPHEAASSVHFVRVVCFPGIESRDVRASAQCREGTRGGWPVCPWQNSAQVFI